MFVSQFFSLIMRIFLVVFLAKVLGPEGYGQFSAILAFTLIIEILFRSGLTGSIVKHISADEEKTYSLARFGFLSQTVLSTSVFLVVFLGAGVWARYIFNDISITGNLRIASLYFVPFALFCMSYSIALGRREFGRVAVMTSAWFFLRTFVTVVFVMHTRSVSSALYAIFAAALLGLAPVGMLMPRIEKKKSDFDRRPVVILAALLIVSAVSLRAVYQVDKLFIKNMIGADDIVGVYALASNFSLILQLFAMSMIATLFPSMSTSFAKSDMALTRKYLATGTRYLLLMLLPVAFALNIVARDVIRAFFGGEYLVSLTPFAILIFASALFAFFLLYRQMLVSLDRQRMNVVITVSVLALALVLNPIFITRYGFLGAAWATFAAAAAGAAVSGLCVFSALKQGYPWLSLARILAASVVCYFLALLAAPLGYAARYGVYLLLAGGFFGILFASRELTRDDVEYIKSVFKKGGE